MIPVLAISLQILLATGDPCYFVSNTRIRVLPSCDIDPSAIDELTEDPSPVRASSLRRGAVPARRLGRPIARPTIVVRGNDELEGRLQLAEQQRLDAVSRRVSAEMQRDAAVRQRDAALRELATARRELAALRERLAQRTGEVPAGEADPVSRRAPPGSRPPVPEE